MKGVNIFLADGFEDIEALATNDVLRRGGVKTNLVAIGENPYTVSSHGIMLGVDNFFPLMEIDHEGTDDSDVMIFPGGMPGSKNLASCKALVIAMKEHYAAGGTVAAICAAPGLVLGQMESLEGISFTCFDGFEDYLTAKGGIFTPRPAVSCGRVITGRSAAHAVSFGLEILKKIKGEQKAAEVEHAMYLVTE